MVHTRKAPVAVTSKDSAPAISDVASSGESALPSYDPMTTPESAAPCEVDKSALSKAEARKRSHRECCKKNYPRTRDSVLAASKRWRDKNRAALLAQSRLRHEARKNDPEYVERRRQQARDRYRRNASGVRDKTRSYNKTAAHRYCVYRAQARRSGRTFNITREQFDAWFFASACSYCGTARVDPDTLGIDRFVNDVGYEPSNCRACCATCNFMKIDVDTRTFLSRCRAICAASTSCPPALTAEQINALPIMRGEKHKSETFCRYKNAAATRGYEFALERSDFMRLIDEPCHYCWVARGGIDRVDDTVGVPLIKLRALLQGLQSHERHVDQRSIRVAVCKDRRVLPRCTIKHALLQSPISSTSRFSWRTQDSFSIKMTIGFFVFMTHQWWSSWLWLVADVVMTAETHLFQMKDQTAFSHKVADGVAASSVEVGQAQPTETHVGSTLSQPNHRPYLQHMDPKLKARGHHQLNWFMK